MVEIPRVLNAEVTTQDGITVPFVMRRPTHSEFKDLRGKPALEVVEALLVEVNGEEPGDAPQDVYSLCTNVALGFLGGMTTSSQSSAQRG